MKAQPELEIEGVGAAAEGAAFLWLEKMGRRHKFPVKLHERLQERKEVSLTTIRGDKWQVDVKTITDHNRGTGNYTVERTQYKRDLESGKNIVYFFWPATVFIPVALVKGEVQDGRGSKGSGKPFLTISLREAINASDRWSANRFLGIWA